MLSIFSVEFVGSGLVGEVSTFARTADARYTRSCNFLSWARQTVIVKADLGPSGHGSSKGSARASPGPPVGHPRLGAETPAPSGTPHRRGPSLIGTGLDQLARGVARTIVLHGPVPRAFSAATRNGSWCRW